MRIHVEPNLVVAARRGDRKALEELTGLCRELFERRLTRDGAWGEEREEIMACALETVVVALPRFAGRAAFETWATGILLRVTWRYRQRRATDRERVAAFSEHDAPGEGEPLEARVAAPDDVAHQHLCSQLRQALADCLAQVNAEMRETWVHHRLWGRRHQDIAETLRIKPQTVGTRIHRVDRQMRKCLSSKGFSPEDLGL